jgi:hypothetical protein
MDFDIADTWTTGKCLLWQWPLGNPDSGNPDVRSSGIFWANYSPVLPTENIITAHYYYYYSILLGTVFPALKSFTLALIDFFFLYVS